MKTQIIHYAQNPDLPASVRGSIDDEGLQTVFRSALNNHLSQGATEMSAYIKAYGALQTAGAVKVDGKWIRKDGPTVGDVHVNAPLGSRKPKEKDDPDADAADVGEFEEIATHLPAEVLNKITGPLAAGVGLPVEDLRKIAAHFAGPDALTEAAMSRDAWGGSLAAKWAARALAKHEKDGAGPDIVHYMPPVEVAKAARAALTAIAAAGKGSFEIIGTIEKIDAEKQMIFGWFSIVSVGGKPVVDTQNDTITAETIEDAAYDFVLHARTAGEMHGDGADGEIRGVGRLVESCVFTPQKVQAMVGSLKKQGIDATIVLNCIPWWGGMKIDDTKTWDKVKAGELKAWSIGGKDKRAAV